MACLWAGVSRIVYEAGRGEVSAVHFESRHANTIDYIRDAFRDDLAVEGNVLAAECMTLYSRRDEGIPEKNNPAHEPTQDPSVSCP